MEWVRNLFVEFSAATVYFVFAAIGTTLFILKTLASLLLGGDAGDLDLDINADGGDVSHIDSDSAFSLVSLQSILAFLMGFGWAGLGAKVEWEMGNLGALGIASGFGFGLMFLSSFIMYQVTKLNQEIPFDLKNCVGSIGRVYLTIPSKGEGRGQVEITVDGRRRILNAITNDKKIESFASVKVLEVRGDDTLIVELVS